ncbi:1-deoxy-D-xylulose-5-phosphate reductoisomerase [Alkalicoccus saliphilus]|uniref:1-deoxy-D-xylulose 5-phosphate reductoisomerase n=1 Tax=Alkalicoccus saliphilus TaxID=200989 RepID=A0A2T4U8A7_9BACI|nr:1-deoxy-D-xylulose-5-phosphate reductoisomerase [Alkalicoccus saliphilus]PTL39627.1 1-deoxy-D-xylulose-5-phosphate reductoisomerase [Alkalicoccus saliphilus]
MKSIHLLGATGSIGEQTLDVLANHPEEFKLVSLAYGRNTATALPYIEKFQPELISVQGTETAHELRGLLTYHPEIVTGKEGLIAVAEAGSPGDILVNAVMGSVGLPPTLKAMESGKDIAIANKETLVTAGHIVTELQRKYGVKLIPVDSEHSAIYQCLHGDAKEVEKLILTASGGSFRDKARKDLQGVTVKEALNHPNWSMGAKITVDSATMMNKGLEVIEAHWLFGVDYDDIDVVLHKESIVHSMVEYVDGSILAHLGTPDMRVPIQYALTQPSRLAIPGSRRLKLWEAGALHFEKMDYERFRALKLAIQAGREGGSAPAVLNAANEQAVAMFLEDRIRFLEIDEFVERALEEHETLTAPSLEEILEIDQKTRSSVADYSR